MVPSDSDTGNNKEILAKTNQVNYGAISATANNNDNTATTEHTLPGGVGGPVLSPEPPKPAVRQRILKKTNNNESDAKGKTATGVSNDAFEMGKEYEDVDLRQREQPAGPSNDKQQQPQQAMQLHTAATPTTKGANVLPMPTETQTISLPDPEQRPYPKKVLFIIANEFCERFSYYGLRGVLVLYFKSVLGFSDSSSTVSYHIFATLCYLTPILGAILGDSVWGKFKTILYLSMVYLLGEIILVSSSVFWDLDGVTVALTCIGLLLISVGTGGIKPCVSALGGDQFLPNEVNRRESFFSLFYGAINLGALISLFVTPIFRSRYKCFGRSDCYPFAFGVPSVLMLVAIFFFLLAAKHYVLYPLPEENVIWAFCRCSWLALKRKLAGQRLADVSTNQMGGCVVAAGGHPLSVSASTLDENLSVSSGGGGETATSKQINSTSQHNNANLPTMKYIDEEQQSIGKLEPPNSRVASTKLVVGMKQHKQLNPDESFRCTEQKDQNHWLYLASDRFDSKSIEEFRSVWRVILLFLPTPVYWCLFDQQSSLWTLQATRMNGEISEGFTLEPDQMSVANPVLLLLSIPLIQLVVYPTFNKCNLLTNPISKMTAGGLLAALTFIASAWIELQIQQSQPAEVPSPGYANLLLVNGLPDCSLVEPAISYVPIPDQLLPLSVLTSSSGNATVAPAAAANASSLLVAATTAQQQTVSAQFGRLEPLKATALNLQSSDGQDKLNTYQIKFKLSNDLQRLVGAASSNGSGSALSSSTSFVGCPFNLSKENEVTVGPLADQTVKLLYVEQGNGKLTYKLFNDELKLPQAGRARVRLLFEFFGSIVQAEKRQFSLTRLSSTREESARPHPELKFNLTQRNGQVLVSSYIDVEVPSRGDLFALQTGDSLLNSTASNNFAFKLEPGTRNLLLAQQTSASQVEVRLELLQGNQYRVSILYQFVPYLMISMSEVMFSITEMELAYSMAPETMKSVVLSLVSLTVAVGNILTVAVESVHPFANVVHDFLFYATLMFVDICVFALIGFYNKPHRHAEDDKRGSPSGRQSNGSGGRLKQRD